MVYTAEPAVTTPVHPRGPQPPDTRLPYSVIFSGTGWKMIAESLSRRAAASLKQPPLPTAVLTQSPEFEFVHAEPSEVLGFQMKLLWARFLRWYHSMPIMPGVSACVSCHMACTKNNLASTFIIVVLLVVIFVLLCVMYYDEVEPEEANTDEVASSMDMNSEFDEEEKENYIPRRYAGETWDARSRFESPGWVRRGYTNMHPHDRYSGGVHRDRYLQEMVDTGSEWVRPGRSRMPGSEAPLSVEEQVERQLLRESMLHTGSRDQAASGRSSSMFMGPQGARDRNRYWESASQSPQVPSGFYTHAQQTANQFRTPAPQAPSQFRTQVPFRDGATVNPFTTPNQRGQVPTNQGQGLGYVSLLRQALEEAVPPPQVSPGIVARISPAVPAWSQTPPPLPRRSERISSRANTPFGGGQGHKGARTPRGPRNLGYL